MRCCGEKLCAPWHRSKKLRGQVYFLFNPLPLSGDDMSGQNVMIRSNLANIFLGILDKVEIYSIKLFLSLKYFTIFSYLGLTYVFLFALNAHGQQSGYEYQRINFYPTAHVYPKYAVKSTGENSVDDHIVLISTTAWAQTCKDKPAYYPFAGNVSAERNGNSFSILNAWEYPGYLVLGPAQTYCYTAYPVSLGKLTVGAYTVTIQGVGSVIPTEPTATPIRIDFAVLTIEQAKKGVVEIPAEGSVQSGIGLISGWSCVAEIVEISIDGGSRLRVPSESPRADVTPVCSHPNAGFGLLFNFNVLSEGEHTIQLFVKNIAIGALRKFRVVKPKGEFASGLRGEVAVQNFPETGKSTTLDWREAEQRFGIKSIQ
jgi:hypothetical protein